MGSWAWIQGLLPSLFTRLRWSGILLLLFTCHTWAAPYAAQVTPVFDRDFRQVFLDTVARSQDSLYVSIYLFKTDSPYRNSAADLQEALILAAKRGVRVSVLFEQPSREDSFLMEANLETAQTLAYFGVHCYFDPAARMHTKMLISDGRTTLMGSHNYTVSAMRHNREASVLIESEEFADAAVAYIEGIIGRAVHLSQLLGNSE